jgi:outer membrane lipoprotein-sorting protein
MKKVNFLVSLLLLTLGGFAQTGYTPIKDETKVKALFAEVPTKVKTIQADFVQEKNLSALTEKLISKGMFYFEKDNKVRLDYNSPFKYLMVMNNGKMLIKENGKTTKMDLRSNKVFEQVNRIMTDCVSGNALNNPSFSTKIVENGTLYKLEMTPIVKGLKDYFAMINIFIDKKDFTATRL